MGAVPSIKRANFETVQNILENKAPHCLLISVFPENEQNCLISDTLSPKREAATINQCIGGSHCQIIIYGRNSTDKRIYDKYQQLSQLGLLNVYLYAGGLFEWLLLQDIYGADQFPTTTRELDILKYRPRTDYMPQLPQLS